VLVLELACLGGNFSDSDRRKLFVGQIANSPDQPIAFL